MFWPLGTDVQHDEPTSVDVGYTTHKRSPEKDEKTLTETRNNWYCYVRHPTVCKA